MPDKPQPTKDARIPVPDGLGGLSEDENIILERLPSRFRKVYLELRLLQRETPSPANELRRLARSVFDSVLELRELKETERNVLLAEMMAGYNPHQMAPDSVAAHRSHLLRKLMTADPQQLRRVALIFERTAAKADAVETEAPALPSVAPELWPSGPTNETPPNFIRRVYGAFLGKSLRRRKQLVPLDARLYQTLNAYLSRHPNESFPEFEDLSRERVDDLIHRMSQQFSLEEIRRAGTTIERRHQYDKKQNRPRR